MDGADAGTFEQDWPYAKDKNYAYFKERKIQGAELETFIAFIAPPQCFGSKYCQYDYAADRKNLYREDKKITSLDNKSLVWKWEKIPDDEKEFIIKFTNFGYFIKKPQI